MAAYLVYFALPAILMMVGFPIFAVLVLTSLAAVVFVADVPTAAIPTYMFGSLDNFPLLAALSWPVVSMLAELDQRSEAANIPLVLPQGMMPLGFLFMGLLIAIRLLVRGVVPADPVASRSDH